MMEAWYCFQSIYTDGSHHMEMGEREIDPSPQSYIGLMTMYMRGALEELPCTRLIPHISQISQFTH